MHTHKTSLWRLDNFIAINSAIEVDLTGQVNAEIAAGEYIGGTGGQGDLVRGGQMAARGRSIIALASNCAREQNQSHRQQLFADSRRDHASQRRRHCRHRVRRGGVAWPLADRTGPPNGRNQSSRVSRNVRTRSGANLIRPAIQWVRPTLLYCGMVGKGSARCQSSRDSPQPLAGLTGSLNVRIWFKSNPYFVCRIDQQFKLLFVDLQRSGDCLLRYLRNRIADSAIDGRDRRTLQLHRFGGAALVRRICFSA